MVRIFIIFFPRLLLAFNAEHVYLTCKDVSPKSDCRLVTAIAFVESSYRPNAFNPEGSYGLMQVQCRTARYMGFEGNCDSLFNPRINIKYATKYIDYLNAKYNNRRDVIAAYNAGRVVKCRNHNPDKCWPGQYINQHYVDKVVDNYLDLNPDNFNKPMPLVFISNMN